MSLFSFKFESSLCFKFTFKSGEIRNLTLNSQNGKCDQNKPFSPFIVSFEDPFLLIISVRLRFPSDSVHPYHAMWSMFDAIVSILSAMIIVERICQCFDHEFQLRTLISQILFDLMVTMIRVLELIL